MAGLILVIGGLALVFFGVTMLAGWVGGKSDWFGSDVYDRQGGEKIDRQLLDLYFIALVLAPLLGGAVMLVFGLRLWNY